MGVVYSHLACDVIVYHKPSRVWWKCSIIVYQLSEVLYIDLSNYHIFIRHISAVQMNEEAVIKNKMSYGSPGLVSGNIIHNSGTLFMALKHSLLSCIQLPYCDLDQYWKIFLFISFLAILPIPKGKLSQLHHICHLRKSI